MPDSEPGTNVQGSYLPKGFKALASRTDELRSVNETSILHELLQAKGLADSATSFVRGDTYRVVLSGPVRGALHSRADGTFDAFVKGSDGKILAVARLERASSALLSSVTMLAGHAMLCQISSQIDRLQGSVDRSISLMQSERLGKIDAALAFLGHVGAYQPEHHVPMLLYAVQTLSEVLAGLLQDVKQEVQKTPEPLKWLVSRVVWGNSDQTRRSLDNAAVSMRVALHCIHALGQAQLHLNGHEGAARIMHEWLERALDLPLERAEWLARRLPVVTEDERRDRFWINTRQVIERAKEKVDDSLDTYRPLHLEFTSSGLATEASSAEAQ